MGRSIRRGAGGAVAMALACAVALVAAPAAPAAPVTRAGTAAGCSMDDQAQGLPGRASGTPVQVPRRDGRVDQFQAFHDTTGRSGLPFVWHRSQREPGGAYGDWERVSAGTVGPKAVFITGIENAAGGLELFWLDHGGFCHTAQGPDGGAWSAPEGFGLQPAPYHGFLTLFKRSNGTLVAMASSTLWDRSMESRTQLSSDGVWQRATGMGKVPESGVGLSAPGTVTELPDRRLKVTAHEWNADSRYWQLTEVVPNDGRPSGWWGARWERCATPACD
ncbi:hypothetical protein [Streptomyces sp. ISL-11]|uniref:hypothetical protein n=1 Tax=Streptomyces sp. ISL-11 TaxID=2819174 RepID=UPI001BE85539|nr:hypothetical protein [Streptomyces sp. ISL-11]MBT2382911.1 hypothetical protein [Streptomyces sp. ISL-11]